MVYKQQIIEKPLIFLLHDILGYAVSLANISCKYVTITVICQRAINALPLSVMIALRGYMNKRILQRQKVTPLPASDTLFSGIGGNRHQIRSIALKYSNIFGPKSSIVVSIQIKQSANGSPDRLVWENVAMSDHLLWSFVDSLYH